MTDSIENKLKNILEREILERKQSLLVYEKKELVKSRILFAVSLFGCIIFAYLSQQLDSYPLAFLSGALFYDSLLNFSFIKDSEELIKSFMKDIEEENNKH